MKHRIRKLTSLLLSLSLISALTLPAAASNALGEDLSAKDTLLHQETQLSTNVFWSTTYSDLRTENLITYTPNKAVTPIVTYGDALTDRSSVADMAALLEDDGYRVVAGINGDFYNVSTGLPIGMVVTEGLLRSSDAGYYAIGFRADGSAILGKPGVKVSANLGYAVDDGSGSTTELIRSVAAVNKARTNSGLFLYTYDFNAKHTTGTTETGVNAVCTIEQGELAIGSTVTARVDRVEETTVTAIQPDQIVLSANANADAYYTNALRNLPVGSEVTFTVTANSGWEDVEYAIGALYCLAENGAVVPNLAAGSNPRTAVGQKADGTLVFYTIDGRKTGHSIGASLTQIGERLLELGCQTVLCLDGGGSTNLAVTTPDSTTASIINRPSESNRKVTNQIFLVASDHSSGDLDHFYVHAASDYVLAGSTVVHTIRTPDTLTIKNGSTALTSLTLTPGSSVNLSAEAVWNHMTLRNNSEAVTWSFTGDCGSMDGWAFHASQPGSGTITAIAGDKRVSIPVTVSTLPLKTVENFEGATSIFRGSGSGMDVSLNHAADTVALGKGSLKLDYDLNETNEFGSGDYTAEWRAANSTEIANCYTALNLWVYGDGSGNTLTMLYSNGTKGHLPRNIATLDFTGWKQFSIAATDSFSIEGLMVEAPYQATETGLVYANTPRTGTVYIDQITAAFPGTVDNTPPTVTATLDEQDWAVNIKVSDAVDGILPLSSITVARNGDTGQVLEGYDATAGTMKYYLPGPGETIEVTRVTVTAVDASGNIGRASVDIAPYGVGHKFTDTGDYWAADYVDFLYNANITTGYNDGTFRPNQNISRAQFAVMLYRYLKLDESKYADVSLPFADLNTIPEYAIPAIKALYTEGVISGAEKNGRLYFNPNDALTRAQAAAMIGRTQSKGYALADLTFSDNGKIPGYADYYIRTMVAQGVINGYSDGSFMPHSNITRGQMAKILYNLM